MVYLLDSLNQSLCYLKFQRDLYSMTFGICESLNAHDYREMISIIKFLIVINLKVDLYNTLRYMIIGEIIACSNKWQADSYVDQSSNAQYIISWWCKQVFAHSHEWEWRYYY